MKRLITTIFICIIVLVIIFGGLSIIVKQIYPKKYQIIVAGVAKQYNVDELLVYAIIKAESNFEPEIVSNKGAIGLMQLMEPTAVEIADNLNYESFTTEDLTNPEINIKFGIKYFANLLDEYNRNYLLALAAYNAGTGNVKKWIDTKVIKEDGSDIENIPFKETNMYVRKILRDYNIYKKIY